MSEQEQIPPPGPERDALIAVRVMGWKERYPDPNRRDGYIGIEAKSPYIAVSLPSYSTNDAASLEVLKAMEARGYGWDILRDRQGSSAVVRFWQGFRMCGSNLADGLADAITAAAIAALGAGQ